MRYSTAARHAHGLASRSGECTTAATPPSTHEQHRLPTPPPRCVETGLLTKAHVQYDDSRNHTRHFSRPPRPEEAQNRLPPARSASSTRVRTHGPRGARTSKITYLTTGTRTRTRTRADAPTPPRRARDLQTKRAVHIAAARRFDAPSPCRGRSEVGRPKEPMMIHPPTKCP